MKPVGHERRQTARVRHAILQLDQQRVVERRQLEGLAMAMWSLDNARRVSEMFSNYVAAERQVVMDHMVNEFCVVRTGDMYTVKSPVECTVRVTYVFPRLVDDRLRFHIMAHAVKLDGTPLSREQAQMAGASSDDVRLWLTYPEQYATRIQDADGRERVGLQIVTPAVGVLKNWGTPLQQSDQLHQQVGCLLDNDGFTGWWNDLATKELERHNDGQ